MGIMHSDVLDTVFSIVMMHKNLCHKRSSMNKRRIFPKSLKQRGQISKRANSDNFLSMIGYMYESSENLLYTVYKCQQAEITLLFVPTSIFTFLYTTDVQ